ncbi:universal stress protein [Ferrovum sp. PN-J185]|uniref:universal stress protein n=1 Tax=Ferrovum sp. PN-J185 TaxID=1356306 RepID=UPI00079A6689|nr:universal stress protein [Ferrovum sp. PN-J185]KXW55242.1 TRAP-T-associated universal stress protein TeaD [Ferrovum sp. PN-J185]MCC6068057.1 universal stress protein [Ferrovum sp. PN-J185]
MFQHILIPIDGSTLSHKALVGGIAMAKALNAKITIYTAVVEFLPMTEFAVETPQSVMEELEKEANKHLKVAQKEATTAGVPVNVIKTTEFSPYQGIINTAKAEKCDLILMASHGRRGLTGFLLGSETQKVLTHSEIPVLVYR